MRSTPFTLCSDVPLGDTFDALIETQENADIVIREGAVPEWLDCEPGDRGFYVDGDTILLRCDEEHSFLIEGGARVTHSDGPNAAAYITGSVFGALCYQRGLIPLHASAVTKDRQVHAFTGPSGAGKSSMALSLVREGWTFFTDDILVLDPQIPRDVVCYAVQRQAKLWGDSIDYLAAKSEGEAYRQEGRSKRFATARSAEGTSAPQEFATCGTLRSLSLIDAQSQGSVQFKVMTGADAIRVLISSLYRPQFAARIRSRAWLFQSLATLAKQILVERLRRPESWDCLSDTSARTSDHLANFPPSTTLTRET